MATSVCPTVPVSPTASAQASGTGALFAADARVLGIDIGGTHIRMGLVGAAPDYELEHFEIRKSQEVLGSNNCTPEQKESLDHLTDGTASEPAGSPIERLASVVTDFCARNNCKIKAVAIGFPSTIDARREVVVSTPNIKPLQNLPVVSELGARLGLPVFINRDVNFILLSDLEDLKLDHTPESVCGFYIGTGLGNTIMINGRLLVGARGCAAELGHIHVIGLDKPCGCGGTGCIELLAGGLALPGIKEQYFPDSYIGDLFKLHGDSEPLHRYIEHLAAAVSTEMVLIDPELCILGGGVIQMPGFPREYFEQCLYRYARRPCPPGSLKLLYVKESQSAGVRGGGIYASRRLADPSFL